MGEYGYSYQTYFSYISGGLEKSDETFGPLIRKPFTPFVPGRNSDGYSAPNVNRSSEAEGYVTRKTVPVASPPYSYGDEYKHISPSPYKTYPARNDEGWPQQTIPAGDRPQKVDDFLSKIQIEASRPAKFDPATKWRESQQSPPHNGDNGYRDSGNFSSKPTGNTIWNGNHDGARGYGDSGEYGNQGNGYGGNYGEANTCKIPTVHAILYNGASGYGNYGKYGNKDNGFGGEYGNHGKKEGYKPTANTIWKDNLDGYNGTNGYGDYGKYSDQKELKPTGNTTRNDDDERYQPAGNYSAVEPNKPTTGGWTRPNGSGWAPPPRNGTHLSEATNDIGKAMELLTGNAKLTPSGHSTGVNGGYGDYGNKEGYRANGSTYPYDNDDNYPRRFDGERPNPSSNLNKAIKLGKEADGLKSPKAKGSLHSESTNKTGETLKLAEGIKNIGTAPSQSRPVPIENTTPNKDDYRENVDSKYGNLNFAPRPRTPPLSTTNDGREVNYRENIDKSNATRRFGNLRFVPIINSTEAERKYRGTRI